MTVKNLQALLKTIVPANPFVMKADQLNLPEVTTLFNDYLPNKTLTVVKPNAQPALLQVIGEMTIGNAVSVKSQIDFLQDAAKKQVIGIHIQMDLSSFDFNTSFCKFSGDVLKKFGFKTPKLLLQAGGDKTDAAAKALLGGTLGIKSKTGTKTADLLARIPFADPASKAGIVDNYVFDVVLQNITLGDLNALSQFITGGNFDLIPHDIPVANEFSLELLEFVVDPEENELVSFRAEVGSAKGLTIIKKAFEIASFNFSFMVMLPGMSNKVSAVVVTALDIYGIEVDVSLTLPDLFLEGYLSKTTPVKLKPFVSNFLPASFIPDDFELSVLLIGIQLKAPHNYDFEIGLSNLWQVDIGHQKLEMTMLNVYMSGQRGQSPSLSVNGQFAFAGALLYVSAEHNSASNGWKIAGGTVDANAIEFPGFSGDGGLKIGDLITDLGKSYGIKLPASIQSLELKNILISFDTGTDAFLFHCTGEMIIEKTPVTMTVSISITPKGSGAQKTYDAKFGGSLTVGEREFDLVFDHKNLLSDTFLATYSHKNNNADTIELKQLVSDVAPDLGKSIPEGIEIELKDIKFVFLKKQATKQFAFGLDIGASIDLSKLPLVGSKLPKDETLKVDDLDALFSSAPFSETDIATINSLLPPNVNGFPVEGLSKGINLTADLTLGKKTTHLALGVPMTTTQNANSPTIKTGTPIGKASLASVGGTNSASSSTKWIDIQKQLGIFQFNRIGFGYQDNILFLALDAGMALGPLTFTMDGLSIGSPLTKFQPKFDIKGLGLSYNKPPLEIEGALLKLPADQLAPNTKFQFDGLAVVKADEFSLSAIGSYAQMTNGDPSLFVFAQLEAPIGGPPAFFITGVMAGFGFNRFLAIPAQNEVQNFPLLKLAVPPAPGKKAPTQDPEKVLKILEGQIPITPNGQKKKWIAPSPGDYWLGIGLEFTSFELVNSKAILIVEFGHDLVLALLGLSTMQLPQPSESSETYAYVELQLEAVFKPEDGFFGLSAVLTQNSYVLTPDCHLTGGFAFYIWFGNNAHTGQFVITLGGYHPAFKTPSFFPTEPRLGFNWAVSSKVSIKGGAYFALTSSAIMAGGGLEALFHDGILKAWFIAYLDVLISWRPFFFMADIGINLGISLRLNLLICHKTITISIGASVHMWGPPTGGIVKVHLVIVTVSIHFGSKSASAANDPLHWSGFSELLPHSNNVCTIVANSGMYKTQESAKSSSGKTWVVRARDFRFSTKSVIPASSLQAANNQAASQSGTGIHIKPMNKIGIDSLHKVSIFQGDSTTPYDISKWSLEPSKLNVPESLWGEPPKKFTQIPAKPSAKLIDGQLVGYSIAAPPPTPGGTQGIVEFKALAFEFLSPPGESPTSPNVVPSPDFVPKADNTSVAEIKKIMDTAETNNRQNIFDMLKNAKLFDGENGSLTRMVSSVDHLYSDAPMVQD